MIMTRPAAFFLRYLRLIALAAIAVMSAAALRAAPVVGVSSSTFTPAQSGRTHMDVGGVWNGTTEVTSTTGDTFTVVYSNTGDATAFDFTPRIVLPTGFTRVGTLGVSASSGSPVVSGTPGTSGTIDVNLGGYDLPAGATFTLTYGLTTATTVAAGTYQIGYNRNYSLTDAGALVGYLVTADQQNILVRAGDTIVNVTPKQQTRAVGETAEFTVTITNTGLGAVFALTLDESAIYPAGSNLQFVSLTKTAPALAATSSNGGSVLTLPYLAPGDVFTAEVDAVVLSCGSIVNTVTSVHRANSVPVVDTVPVQLNLLQPLIDFTPPAVTLDYNNPVTVSFAVQNTGLGSAYNVRLQSNLNGGGRTVALTPAADVVWDYNASTGLFTYTGGSPSGTIANGASVTLEYTVAITNPCSSSGAGGITYTALYANGCADDYLIPIRSHTISAASGTPTITLQKTVSASRIAVNESGFYTLTASATNVSNISPSGVTITDTLPAQVSYLSHTASIGTVNVVGQTVTWTLTSANLSTPRTLQIDFQVVNEPCNAGQQPNNVASTSNLTTTRGCTLNASANASFFISNNPGLFASQFFDHTGAPTEGYETGNADAAPLGTRGTGEGEFIPLQAGYNFGSAYPGTWAGSTLTDDFGGVTGMVLATNSLTVSGSFGTNVAVPSGSITLNAVGFTVDLGFLAGASFFNNANVANRSVTFNYRCTAPDSAVPGITRSVLQRLDLFLANGGGGTGICNQSAQNRFTQGVFYTLLRAQANVGLSLPSTLEICKPEDLVLTVSNSNAKQARNLFVTLLNNSTHYTVDTTVAPVYGGVFNSGNITYTANAGVNPTFQFTGNPLTGNGTIQLRVRRKANGNTTPGALTARVDYDSWQTAAAGSRVYNSTGSYTPSTVRRANLALNVSPGTISVTGSTISYIAYLTNTDAGAAYGATLTSTLPVGFTINTALTDAANPGFPVSVSTGTGGRAVATWAVGDLASGVTRAFTLHANVGVIAGCSITVNPAIERLVATWGCDGDTNATVTRASPNFVFPAGKMQIVHDSTQTVARFCTSGKVVVTVKNTGPTNIQGVIVRDVIPPSAGFSISHPVQYRLNGGALQNAASLPTGDGSSGTPYTWASTQIPALAQLVPVGVSGTNQIDIEITLVADSSVLQGQNPVLSASGEATISCGTSVSSPAQPFTIPIERPIVSVAKTGRNTTAGDVAFSESVYGGQGDTVEWRLIVTNTGLATAENLRLSDTLTGSGGTAVINGPGLAANTPFTAGQVLSIPNLAASGGSATYTITEILGASCQTGSRDADVSWGCTSNGASTRSSVTAPGTPVDPATIVMNPVVAGGTQLTQSVTSLAGGRALVTVNITNNGGTLYNPVATVTLPSYAVHDTTGPVTLTTASADITSVSRTGGTDAAPVFTFGGTSAPHILRFGQTITFTYYVRPTTFDAAQATGNSQVFAQEGNPALDPNNPTATNASTLLEYTNSCGGTFSSSHAASLAILLPDIDISGAPGNAILTTATAATNYDYTVINNGPVGSSANFIEIIVRVGKAWNYSGNPQLTWNIPSTGTAISGLAAPSVDSSDTNFIVYTYTLPAAFVLTRPASGTNPAIRVRLPSATVLDNGTSLVYQVETRGEARGHDGAAIYGNHSLDRRAARFLGIALQHDILSTSEPTSAQTLPSTANVLIGEEVTYRIRAKFFGAYEDITSPIVRVTHADINDSAHFGLGYVGHTLTAGNLITPSSVTTPVAPVGAPAAIANARVSFNLPTLAAATVAAGQAVFETDFVTRVLNISASTDSKALRNNLSLSFTYLGTSFRSNNNADDGFTGGTATTALQASRDVTVTRPQLNITKTVRNVTRGGSFAATAGGEAGDVIEYRLQVSNPASAGDRPLRTLRVTDTVPAKLNLSASNQGADTNGSPASIEVANSGGVSGLGATIVFDATNTPIASAGQDLDQLNPGQTLSLLYRGTLASTVIPNEVLSNTAASVGYSIPVDGSQQALNQTAPKGTAATGNPAGAATAALRLDAAATAATVTIDAITQLKSLQATSTAASVDPLVFVGEQLRYRVALTLPQGTVPNLIVTDTLPAGLAPIGTPAVVVGANITPTNNPPTFTQVGQLLTWDFGQTVTNGAGNTITLDYLVQVRNVAGNVAGTVLTNSATYSFTGAPINLNQVSVTVAEPAVALVHQVRNVTRATAFAATAPADAGDILEYRVALTNPAAANRAPAYDLAFAETLPAGLTYVAGSTVTQTATGLTGTLGEPDVAGQLLTWGRTQTVPVNLDLAIGTDNFEFRYRATVDVTSAPLQVYANALVADWTSLDGNPTTGEPILAPDNVALGTAGGGTGERIGTGTSPNLYRATGTTTVTALNSTTVTKVKSGDTLPVAAPASGFRVGDLVTYTLTLPVQEGTLAAFRIGDTLPAGLAFHDTVSLTPATNGGSPSPTQPFAYTTPTAPATAPAAGATGAIAWQFGTLVNTGDNDTNNDTLTLVYRARVIDPAGIAVTPADQTLTNSATVAFTLANSSTHTSAVSSSAIVARQPILALAKAILSPATDALGFRVVRPGDTASYRLTVTNSGTAPAYNLTLTDTLPAGLRGTTPVLTAATLNGVDVLASLTAPTWNGTTGEWTFALADGEFVGPSQTLVVTYTVTVDNNPALRGLTLTNTATATQFFSLPSGDAEAASRRQYAPVGPATAALVVGLRIDGSVYHDVQPNNAKDVGEDWSGAAKPTVFANLVTTGGSPSVFRTVTVNPGTGAFAFDYLPPGSYNIVVTNTAVALAAQRPANWLFQSPTTGTLAAAINNTTGDLSAQDLGLNQGIYAAPAIAKAKSGDTLPRTNADALGGSPSGFRIGDLITYTVTVNPQEGALTGFAVTDTLPAGLAFHDTVSITPASGGRYTYTTPSGGNAPALNSAPNLTWTFGAFTNAISGPATNSDPAAVETANRLTITYRARVRHDATGNASIVPLAVPAVSPAATSSTLTNAANVGYTKPAPDAGAKAAGPATAAVEVSQPRLTIAKTRTLPLATPHVIPGGTATFQVVVANDGTAPAYNTLITDIIPAGMRGTAPSSFSATLNGSAVTLTPAWTAGTGSYVVTLSDTQIIQPGQSLTFTYVATVDTGATRGAQLDNTATITSYGSRRSADSTQRRTYTPGLSATASVVVGMAVSGTVYHDLQPNNTRDVGEDWTGTGEPTVYVNLVQTGAVVASFTVNPGTGAYSFTNLPAGSYDLVLTDSAVNTVASRPANWPFQNPGTGTLAITLSNADLTGRDFGLHQGTLVSAQIAKAKAGDTLPLSAPAAGFRIGDLVTYTIDVQPREGPVTDFVITDSLPAGLAFVQTVSIGQVSGAARFTYTTPTGGNAPAADATGTLTWDFGAFDNALFGPADNTLRIVYTARVLDTAGVAVPAASPAATSTSRVNTASLAYDDGAPVTVGPALAPIAIEQPRLIIAKTRVLPADDNVVMPGGSATFRLTVTNNGSAPAYNVALADTLPVGLRLATPTLTAATLNGVDVLATISAPAYVAGTGVWSVALADGEILLPGQTLVLDYAVTVDVSATRGDVLTNSALVTAYASKPSADTSQRRVYAPTAPSSQNLVVGMQVAGFVYHELIPNDLKDPTEDWTSGVAVFVNLVANTPVSLPGLSIAADQVVRSVAVPGGTPADTGAFAFTRVPPGDYRIVVTDTAVNNAPAAPATWTFDTPSTGSLTPVVATNADIADQNLGLYRGRIVSGRVYNDASPFGTRESETWLGGVEVVVNLVNIYGAPVVHASATVPAGVGTYEFTNVPPGSYRLVVAPAGQITATTATAPTNWVFTAPESGTRDSLTVALADLTEQDFGLTLGRTVSGFVYNDTTPNSVKDGFEDWTTGPAVVVNLIDLSDGSVFATANVPPGTGAYAFTVVPPGNYRVIVTNAAGSTSATPPPTWIFRAPNDGAILVTVSGADVTDRNFGLFRGRTVSGVVFRDSGVGGATPNDGTRQPSEPGIGNVRVRLLDSSFNVLDTTFTDGAGIFRLRIPAETVNGATLHVEELNPSAHRSTGAQVGSAGGTYNRTTDRVTFTFPDDDVTDVRLGDVPENAFLTDGAQSILPGATAFYRHTYTAGSGGVVTFSFANTASPSVPWTQVLVRDLNCNGQIDAGEPMLADVPVTVTAGEEICLILKDSAPANAPYGGQSQTVITASFVYTNASPAMNDARTRQDVTTIGTTTAAGLQLTKAVDKTTAAPGETITYTITYTNAGIEPLDDLFIDDRTPHYTLFVSASNGPLPLDLTAVNITSPAVGAAGTLRWTFTGTLAPGATGTVTFQVMVQP